MTSAGQIHDIEFVWLNEAVSWDKSSPIIVILFNKTWNEWKLIIKLIENKYCQNEEYI